MFEKVLIANRGAIACRIIRTLRRMGVKSVAVYTDADALSRHALEADEAYCIGSGVAAESYLRADKILEIAQRARVQAIHPGYGFLSEKADFAEQCVAHGICFIGPTPKQMRDFGLKHTARELALQNGLPLLPGTGLLEDVEEAVRQAAHIGYPVMLKSTAGGGGIGMRLCWNRDELSGAYESVKYLAQNNFKRRRSVPGKICRQCPPYRSADFWRRQGRGNCAGGARLLHAAAQPEGHRRNASAQPAVARAPGAAGCRDAFGPVGQLSVRRYGGIHSRRIHRANFYFLEVNTRLQVEHGVTEEVTGIDLVEWMVRQAAGDLPPLDSFKVEPRGASIQARVYAENPAREFQPSCGALTGSCISKPSRSAY